MLLHASHASLNPCLKRVWEGTYVLLAKIYQIDVLDRKLAALPVGQARQF